MLGSTQCERIVIEVTLNQGGISWESKDAHVANIRSPHIVRLGKSLAAALVKGLKVCVKHKHYKSHSFISSFLMWQREQNRSPLEQLQFPATTRHRSNKKNSQKKKGFNWWKGTKGPELSISHTVDRTSKWNISLNAQHWVLFTVELAVCVHL